MQLAWHTGLTEDTRGRVPDPAQLWRVCNAYTAAIVQPGTTVELRFTPEATLSSQPVMSAVHNLSVTIDALACEARGFAGFMVAGSIDPGLDEVRSVTHFPVVGVLEAGLAFSSFIGRRVGIVTVPGVPDPLGIPRTIELNARRYGYGDRLISNRPVRTIFSSHKDFYRAYGDAVGGNADEFLEHFDAACVALAADGAEAVVCGNQLFGPVLYQHGLRSKTKSGIPFVCNTAAGLKSLEALAALRETIGLQKSELGIFRPLTSPSLDDAFAWLTDALTHGGQR